VCVCVCACVRVCVCVDYSVTVVNNTDEGTVSHVYTAQLTNDTAMVQTYTFHDQPVTTTFAGVSFPIQQGAVKWSVHLDTGDAGGMAALSVSYTLSSILSGATGGRKRLGPSAVTVTVETNTPVANMTTYVLPLATDNSSVTTVALLQVFDVAIIDGTVTTIGHNVSSVANGASVDYVLRLDFPSFTSTVRYDPSLGLGVVSAASATKTTQSSSGSSSAAVGIGIGVALGLCGLVVVLVAVAAAVIVKKRKNNHQQKARSMTTDPWGLGCDMDTLPTQKPWVTERLPSSPRSTPSTTLDRPS
jgi:hypothetical protein